MPLPSQQPRSTGINPPTFGKGGRRRARRRRFGAIIVIVLAAIAVWYFWPGGESKTPLNPASASAESDAPQQAAPRSTPQANRKAPAKRKATSLADRLRAERPVEERDRPAKPAEHPTSALAARNEANLAAQAGAQEPPEATTIPEPKTGAAPEKTSRSADSNRPSEPERDPEPGRARQPSEALASVTSGTAAQAIERADSAIARNEYIEARDILNRALHNPRMRDTDKPALRTKLAEIAETLTFSPRVFPGDITADTYTIQSGDVLGAIPKREGFHIDHRLIQRINKIENPRRIRVGQKLKVLYGPFHLVIDKSEFRMDLYAEQADTAGNRLYIRSFPVGLGEFGSTPTGMWRVPARGVGEKLINPGWTNPRTNKTFKPDDPDNPIGERWIPIEGIDPHTQGVTGYGIHGTIEPDSIGRQMSMGCIRMNPDDVELVYELLVYERSTIEIVD